MHSDPLLACLHVGRSTTLPGYWLGSGVSLKGPSWAKSSPQLYGRSSFPCHLINEQEAILQKYLLITAKIDAEQKHFRERTNEKKGLMHDLLNGRVKVTR